MSLDVSKIKQVPLPESQYIKEVTEKKQIVLHHTAGNSSGPGTIKMWANDDRGRIATCIVISGKGQSKDTYDGEICQAFSSKYWGYHLMLDCAGCDHDKIGNRENIYNFTKELVKRIDMKAFGEPWIAHFGTGAAAGYTVVQLIETSNICGHFVDENGDFYLDVFSCKDFNENIVTDFIQQCFFPENIKSEVFLRDARK